MALDAEFTLNYSAAVAPRYYYMVTSFPELMLLILLLNKAKNLIVTSSEFTLFDLTYPLYCRVGATVTFERWVRCLSKLMKMNKKYIYIPQGHSNRRQAKSP